MRLSILFFDDDPRRHELFAKFACGHWVDHCWFVDDAVERLGHHRYDLACLDHDLATEGFLRDGREVVAGIVRLPDASRPRAVLVHSWNPLRSIDMELALASVYEPGVTLRRATFGTFVIAPPGQACGADADLGRWISPGVPEELIPLVQLLDGGLPPEVSLEEA